MINKDDIVKYFEEINEKLAARGKRGDIVIAGGAALAVVFDARSATHDIDAMFQPPSDFREIIDKWWWNMIWKMIS